MYQIWDVLKIRGKNYVTGYFLIYGTKQRPATSVSTECVALWENVTNVTKVMSTNMAANHLIDEVTIEENEIFGATLVKDIKLLTKSEAVRWLKCRGCTNLCELTLKYLQNN